MGKVTMVWYGADSWWRINLPEISYKSKISVLLLFSSETLSSSLTGLGYTCTIRGVLASD